MFFLIVLNVFNLCIISVRFWSEKVIGKFILLKVYDFYRLGLFFDLIFLWGKDIFVRVNIVGINVIFV